MILVQIKKEKNNISELTIEGHASVFYFSGNRFEKFIYFLFSVFFKKRISLLCCAVSVLFKTLEMALDEDGLLIKSEEKSGYLKLYVRNSDLSKQICKMFLLGVYELQSEYPNELKIEEVNND